MRTRWAAARPCLTFLSVLTVLWASVPAAGQTAFVYPGREWVVSSPEAEGMDPAKFAAAMDKLPSPAVVIRHGKIIGAKGNVARPGPLFSGSKALLATLAGRLIQTGKITLDTPVPGSDRPSPPQASIRQFLTMTSDFNLTPHSPGEHYAYSNSAANFYGQYLIYTFFPRLTEPQALRAAYLDKIGIQDPLELIGSLSGWGNGGFVMSTRDYARLGYLIVRGGVWNGERLLPQWFADGLYINQIPAGATAGGAGSGDVDNQQHVTERLPGSYSWGWWLPNGPSGFEGSRSNTVACTASGAYGTSMHVLPQYDLVLAAVNTVSTASGGRIPGELVDEFAAAVATKTPPAWAPPSVEAVVNGASFAPGAAAGAWISIFGKNLAQVSRTWRDSEIVDGALPVQLDSVSVNVGGNPAAVYYVSPGQLDVQVPSGAAGSSVPLQVITPGGQASTSIMVGQLAPALFTYGAGGNRYAAAQHADYGILGPVGLYATSKPARPGETIILYGTGFGPTSPGVPAGRVVTRAAPLAEPVSVWIAGIPARVEWAGLSAAGLYQLNVLVPDGAPDGDAPVLAGTGGARTQAGVYVAITH